jgi:hypothetical protein
MSEKPIRVELLTDDERINAICNAYWACDETGEFVYHPLAIVAQQHQTTVAEVLKLVERHCRAVSTAICCANCGMTYQFKNRTDFNQRRNSTTWTCHLCIAQQAAAVTTNKKNRLLADAQKSLAKSISINDLSLTQVIELSALLRFGATEDYSTIVPYRRAGPTKLSPHSEYDMDLITNLFKAGILAIHPDSATTKIHIEADGTLSYSVPDVAWLLCADNPVAFGKALTDRLTSLEFIRQCYVEFRAVSKLVAKLECLAFLEHALSCYRLAYSPDEMTNDLIERALDSFAVNQIHDMIWKGAEQCARHKLTPGGAAAGRAARSIVSRIEKQMERAEAATSTPFTRYREMDNKQSHLSRIVFNTIMCTDDAGFTTKISDLLPAQI